MLPYVTFLQFLRMCVLSNLYECFIWEDGTSSVILYCRAPELSRVCDRAVDQSRERRATFIARSLFLYFASVISSTGLNPGRWPSCEQTSHHSGRPLLPGLCFRVFSLHKLLHGVEPRRWPSCKQTGRHSATSLLPGLCMFCMCVLSPLYPPWGQTISQAHISSFWQNQTLVDWQSSGLHF